MKATVPPVAVSALALFLASCSGRPGEADREKGTYPHLETSFSLNGLSGNPFDYRENDVKVVFRRPNGGTAAIPAFYDGTNTWRARYTPDRKGRYTIAGILRNGKPVTAGITGPRDFTTTAFPTNGFVRVDPRDRTRLAFDNGTPYYPVGYNIGWGDKSATAPDYLQKAGNANVNWSRVWMCVFDDRSLDWSRKSRLTPGQLDLDAAQKWDDIVNMAAKQDIFFQMVLQHHGQYNTNANPNWAEHPWNSANGGWLESPADFFTDARAIELTRLRYRYIIARWGYSPNILAWEMFNEVELTDAMQKGQLDDVAAWHRMMIAFIREHDPCRHLITSSSLINYLPVLGPVDYYQPHVYPTDPVPALMSAEERTWNKPYFFGEIGPNLLSPLGDTDFVRRALWAGMTCRSAGTAQYWHWEKMEPENLYGLFAGCARFARESGIAAAHGIRRLDIDVQTDGMGPLTFRPGGGWKQGPANEATVLPDGRAPGAETMQRYLHGTFRRELMTNLVFNVNFPAAGEFHVDIETVSLWGARLAIEVDGQIMTNRVFPAGNVPAFIVRMTAPVPAGPHTVTLVNGYESDWLLLGDITLTPYAPHLGALGKANDDFALLWIYRRDPTKVNDPGAVSGNLAIRGMKSGAYNATWWDTTGNRPEKEVPVTVPIGKPLSLTTPAITNDIALLLKRAQ